MDGRNHQFVSPFVIGKVVKDPQKFWGRGRDIRSIIGRLQNMESTSIVGPRRIGKSSLAYYVYHMGSQQLGDKYEFVWLDGQSNHATSVNGFFKEIYKNCSIESFSSDDTDECLMYFEDAVKGHDKRLVLILNEFELLVDARHQDEFNVDFFNTLRLLAEMGQCAIITTSCVSLVRLCEHVLGVSSPFYNIFIEVGLGYFSLEEATGFLNHRHGEIQLTSSEVDFIEKNVNDYKHPLVLQIACDLVAKNRQLKLVDDKIRNDIAELVSQLLSHEEIKKGREMKKEEQGQNDSRNINRSLDLLVSILIPVVGIGLIMLIFGMLIRSLSNSQAILLALFTAILGYAVMIFSGRYVNIIRETTFYRLSLRLIDQIPLLSNLADKIIRAADRIKHKE